jgi:DNA-binding beta-propeller fold protein YncE/tRNA A-37 threonylcarbamoyl transferase component Bud32
VSATPDVLRGTVLAGYRVEALLGRGGMGVVYLAEDLRLKRRVALKLLAPELSESEAFRERFLRESELAASLDHPNVVPIYEAGEAEGRLYIAMRYVEGDDLKALLADGPLEPERAVALVGQVAAALDAAHERALVHRDVKPSNVLVDRSGHAYLGDFGLTRLLAEPSLGVPVGSSLGTPDYVAPEQIRGEELDGRADVYSLGCLLYEALSGRPPFARESEAALLFAHLEEQPPSLPGLEDVLPRALAKDREERYTTATALVGDAREALGLGEPQADRRPLALAVLGIALVAAGLLAFFLTRGGGSPAPLQGGRLLRIDPGSNRVAAAIPVGDGPAAVAVGSGKVWVASYRDGTLWQHDPRTGGVAKIASVGRPFAVTIHGGSAYVAALGPGVGNVTQYDAVTGGRNGGVEKLVCSIASGPYGVWVAGCPNVEELTRQGSTANPTLGGTVVIPYARPLTAANLREALSGIAEGEGAVWVVGDPADRRLWRIDPARHRIAATISLGFPPAAVAAGGGAVWVSDELGDRLVRIDPATNRVERSIPVAAGAAGVAYGGGSVWVASAVGHTVTRVDPKTDTVIATLRVAASPEAIAVGEGSVWVAGDAR